MTSLKFRIPLQFISISILLANLILAGTLGCTTEPSDSLIQTKPFKFDLKHVTQLTLSKSDPSTDDRWMTTFQQKNPNLWEITSPPQNLHLGDTLVDETFIAHLLDVFQDIRVEAQAPRGSMSSYGLEPPLFAIRWQTSQQSWEFRVGSRSQDEKAFYFTMDGEKVYLASGPGYRLLKMIDTFQFLRKRTWTTLVPDDIDEIQLIEKGKPTFYAQREGERWTDRKHRKIQKDMDLILKELVLAPIEQFVDDAQSSIDIRNQVQRNLHFEVRLSDRHGNITLVQMAEKNHVVYGLNSTRPGSVFALSSKLLPKLKTALH